MTDDVLDFIHEVARRIEHGSSQYGDQSFVRPVAATVAALVEEQVDQVGWCYVLWCQAARKTDTTRNQQDLRFTFLRNLEHRIRRNDRRAPHEGGPAAASCMVELEVLALDLFEQRAQLLRRLNPIARAIEVAQYLNPYVPHGRRGSTGTSRSSD